MRIVAIAIIVLLGTADAVAQQWTPALRSTTKLGTRFWQRGIAPVMLIDYTSKVDPALGKAMYGFDSKTLVARWNVKSSDGSFVSTYAGDFDGNGFNDHIAHNTVYLNTATSQQLKYSIPEIESLIGIADLDNDGMADACDGYHINYSDGIRPLTRSKAIALKREDRASYQVHYMDTLGGKVLFLTSWALYSKNSKDVVIAIEELSPEGLHGNGDTLELHTVHTFSFPTIYRYDDPIDIVAFIYDDVWYINHSSAEYERSFFSITADAISVVTPDPSFFTYNALSIGAKSYCSGVRPPGSAISVIDTRRPCLVSRENYADTTWSLRYVRLERSPILSVRTLGVLELDLDSRGKTVRSDNAYLVSDVDGDGFEDVCNTVVQDNNEPDATEIFASAIYLTGGNVVSKVVSETDTMLPAAIAVEGGWIIHAQALSSVHTTDSRAFIYAVDGRLLASTLVERRGDDLFIARSITLDRHQMLIASIGSLHVRLQ